MVPAGTEIYFVDTSVCFTKPQAKLLFSDALRGEVSDSIIVNLEETGVVNDSIISSQTQVIGNLEQENSRLIDITQNFEDILANKDTESEVYKEQVKVLKKEVRKQKMLKWTGFGAAVLIAILAIMK